MEKSGRYTGDNEDGVENKPTAPPALLYTYLGDTEGCGELESLAFLSFFRKNPHDFFLPFASFSFLPPSSPGGPALGQ